MKGSQGAAEAWHCERAEDIIDEGTTSVAVEAPGSKGSQRKAWQHVVGSESPKRGQEAMGGDHSILELPVHGMNTKDISRCGMESEPRRQAVCAVKL